MQYLTNELSSYLRDNINSFHELSLYRTSFIILNFCEVRVRNLIKRLVGKELIEQSLLELLNSKKITDISVNEIAKNCGISSRAFYNHFHDKHDVVSSIYVNYMSVVLDCTLDEWYYHLGDFMLTYDRYMEHCLIYRGQNCLADTIIDLEWRKLNRHIRPEILEDELEFKRTEIAIEYMLHGNIGSTSNNYIHKKHSALRNHMKDVYDNDIWKYLSANIPPLLLKNLSMEPIR